MIRSQCIVTERTATMLEQPTGRKRMTRYRYPDIEAHPKASVLQLSSSGNPPDTLWGTSTNIPRLPRWHSCRSVRQFRPIKHPHTMPRRGNQCARMCGVISFSCPTSGACVRLSTPSWMTTCIFQARLKRENLSLAFLVSRLARYFDDSSTSVNM